MKMMIEKPWCHIECDEEMTLEAFCEQYAIPVKKMNQMIAMKKAFLNEKHMRMSDSIKVKRLSLCLFEETEIDFVCDEEIADVIYEDDFVLVVNKPAGIIIHEDDKTKHGTLNNRVAAYFKATGQRVLVRPIHRLDKETSGCVMYSKSLWMQSYFDAAIERKEIYRTYFAFVKGKPTWKQRVVDFSIGKHRHQNGMMCISKTGKPAKTRMRCLKTIEKKNISVIQCQLETGRTHQIRLHTSAIQLPIINDALYGVKENSVSSMGLCAVELSWIQPFTHERITVKSELPRDLKELVGSE